MAEIKQNRIIAWLSAAHFTTDAYSGFLNPIMPFIAAKIGITMGVATLLMSISQLFSQLVQPIFGFFADSITKRSFIFWGLILSSLFYPMTACANNIWSLAFFIVVGGLGVSIFHPQSIGFVVKFTKEDFTKNMGIFLSCGSIGYSFGPMIAASITQYFSLEKLGYTSFIGILLALLMFVCVPKTSNIEQKPEKKNIVEVFSAILSNTQVLILILISIMKALISSSCAMLLPFLWKNMGHDAFYIGTAIFAFMLAGGFGSLLSPKFEKWLGTKEIIYISMLSMPLFMAIFVFTYKTLPILALVDFILMAFVLMLATPITMVLAQKQLPQYKSIIGGFLNGFCWGVVGLLIGVIGFLAEKFGILQILFITGVIPALSAYFVKYLKVD